MTAIGAYVLYIKKKVVKDAFDFFLDPSTLMTTGGAIVVFITFFGCMGALRENVCFLKTVSTVICSLKKCKTLSCLADESNYFMLHAHKHTVYYQKWYNSSKTYKRFVYIK